jgi:hypothetical protein
MNDRSRVVTESRADRQPCGGGSPGRGPVCPHCGETLKQGRAVRTSGMIPGAAYCCIPCRMLYTPDLKFLARIVG